MCVLISYLTHTDRDSGEPVKHVQEPASTQCPTIQVILKNGVEATIVAPPNGMHNLLYGMLYMWADQSA